MSPPSDTTCIVLPYTQHFVSSISLPLEVEKANQATKSDDGGQQIDRFTLLRNKAGKFQHTRCFLSQRSHSRCCFEKKRSTSVLGRAKINILSRKRLKEQKYTYISTSPAKKPHIALSRGGRFRARLDILQDCIFPVGHTIASVGSAMAGPASTKQDPSDRQYHIYRN